MNSKSWRWMVAYACVAGALGAPVHASPDRARTVAAALPSLAPARTADFRGETISRDARQVAEWVVQVGDHRSLPFMIVDKQEAKLYAFDARGTLVRTTPVLLGMGIGDVFAPGVAEMDMYNTRPWQRVTPAGRFEAHVEADRRVGSVLWLDANSGIALHKVPARRTAQRRHERLASPDPGAKRITYGCINVPAVFYDEVVTPAYRARGGVVYVLPEAGPVERVFGTYAARTRTNDAPPASRPRTTAAALLSPPDTRP
jgi:hypothetical protein